jgi:hypothetical protein
VCGDTTLLERKTCIKCLDLDTSTSKSEAASARPVDGRYSFVISSTWLQATHTSQIKHQRLERSVSCSLSCDTSLNTLPAVVSEAASAPPSRFQLLQVTAASVRIIRLHASFTRIQETLDLLLLFCCACRPAPSLPSALSSCSLSLNSNAERQIMGLASKLQAAQGAMNMAGGMMGTGQHGAPSAPPYPPAGGAPYGAPGDPIASATDRSLKYLAVSPDLDLAQTLRLHILSSSRCRDASPPAGGAHYGAPAEPVASAADLQQISGTAIWGLSNIFAQNPTA